MSTTVFSSSRPPGHSVGSDGFKKEKEKRKEKKEIFFNFFLLSQGDSWAMMTIREMKAGVMPAQPCSLAPVCPDTHGHVTAFFVFV